MGGVMLRSEGELLQRIDRLRALEDRLDARDWFGRLWVADYSADASIIADALLQEIQNGGEPIASRWHLRRAGVV